MAKMTVALTTADICNLALIQCGADLILSLTDPNDKNAILCQQLLPVVTSICLTREEWSGLTKFGDLGNEVEVAEQADWEFVFPLPEDCLQVIAQIDEGNHKKKFPYIVKGRQLFTNDKSNDNGNSAYIDYISVGDVSKYSPGLIEYIALKLAIAMAPKLIGISEAGQLHIQGMQREMRLRVLPEVIGRNRAEGDEKGGNDEGESTWVNRRSRTLSGLCRSCCSSPCRC